LIFINFECIISNGMKRNLDDYLSLWAQKKRRKPLLLRGARQTGKSYAVEKLGKNFNAVITINFEKTPSQSKLFDQDLSPERIVREIEAIYGKKITPEKTLLFFDEIQNCHSAVTSLRFFYEEMPDLHVIGAGSLLEFEFDKISVPVGRIEFVYVRPFSFIEFLKAIGKDILAEQLVGFSLQNPASDLVHEKILNLLRDYLFIGGMPGILKRFIDDNSYLSAEQEQETILATYRADFNKYCGRAGTNHISKVFETVPRIIGNKVTYSKIDPDARAQQIKNAINLLEKAHILKKVRAASGAGLPLAAGASDKRYKLVFLDVGLMQRLLGFRYREWQEGLSLFSNHIGAVTEQFVGQELSCLDDENINSELYYWDRTARGSTAEVDYVVPLRGNVVPIEVKSSAFGHLKSMHRFLSKYPSTPIGLKVSKQNFTQKGKIIAVPLYAVNSFITSIDEE
jgi:uncharacterized protein